jgi:hypothetical protein
MLAYLFILIAIAVRLAIVVIPSHPFHFTPVGAALLYFGARRSRREFAIPVLMLAASDVYLTRVHYGLTQSWDFLVICAWYTAALFMGQFIVSKTTPVRVMSAALAAAVSFFLVSNFGVWVFGTMYPHNWAGLLQCYTMAIPFFRNTFASDLILTPIAFSIPAAAAALARYVRAGDTTPAA